MGNSISGVQMMIVVLERSEIDRYPITLAFHSLELEVVVVEIVVDGSLNDFSE